MPRINPATFNFEALESRELRQRQSMQEQRAIRMARRSAPRANKPFVCQDCGGDCKTLMAGMQASLKAGPSMGKASASERAKRAWEIIRARRASGYCSKPKAQRETKPCRTGKLRIVQLYLITGCDAGDLHTTHPAYAPNAPVCGLSWYILLSRSRDGKIVTLFHPFTLRRFEVPASAFAPKTEGMVTPFQIAKVMERGIAQELSLKRDICKYVYTIKANLQKGASQ